MSGFFLGLQKILPQHSLSRLVGWLAQSQIPLIRRTFIHLFARAYDISLGDAERKELDDYYSFIDLMIVDLSYSRRSYHFPKPDHCPWIQMLCQSHRVFGEAADHCRA